MVSEKMDTPASMPRLQSFNWRIDTISASNDSKRMDIPTCLLQLNVEDKGNLNVNQSPKTESVTLELSAQTLDTMLDGLSKIRDQLNSVVQK